MIRTDQKIEYIFKIVNSCENLIFNDDQICQDLDLDLSAEKKVKFSLKVEWI